MLLFIRKKYILFICGLTHLQVTYHGLETDILSTCDSSRLPPLSICHYTFKKKNFSPSLTQSSSHLISSATRSFSSLLWSVSYIFLWTRLHLESMDSFICHDQIVRGWLSSFVNWLESIEESILVCVCSHAYHGIRGWTIKLSLCSCLMMIWLWYH